jgi:hypothetical protein
VFGFATALGATTVIYPLLAIHAGFAPAVIGVFTAVSATAQLLTRFWLPWLLTRIPDRLLIVAAGLMIATSAGVLLLSTAAVAFVLAQIAQGGARALFWTASQTHAVRTPGSAVRRLAQVHVASNIGSLTGPAAAGSIAVFSFAWALGVAVTGALAAAAAATLMVHRPPYVRDARAERRGLWWRKDLSLGYWTSFTAGGWRGMVESFVPVVLSGAGLSAGVIGWLIAMAEGAQLLVSAWLARARESSLRKLVRLAALAVLAGIILVPIVASSPLLAALALVLGGLGAGMATTIGPAIANSFASPSEQGTALAVGGAYRAAARMATPGAVAAAGSFIGIPLAMGLVAATMVSPILTLGWKVRTQWHG